MTYYFIFLLLLKLHPLSIDFWKFLLGKGFLLFLEPREQISALLPLVTLESIGCAVFGVWAQGFSTVSYVLP